MLYISTFLLEIVVVFSFFLFLSCLLPQIILVHCSLCFFRKEWRDDENTFVFASVICIIFRKNAISSLLILSMSIVVCQIQGIPAFRDFKIRDPRHFVILLQAGVLNPSSRKSLCWKIPLLKSLHREIPPAKSLCRKIPLSKIFLGKIPTSKIPLKIKSLLMNFKWFLLIYI